MGSQDIIIFGTGQMAQVMTVYCERYSDLSVVGYTVDQEWLTSGSFNEKPLVAWDSLEKHYSPDNVLLLGPLTYQRLNQIRRDRYLEGKARGYRFASFIHPNSAIETDDIGENCIILEGNTIQPFARIGKNNIIWSGNHIGHHVIIGDHCFFSSQVGISGGCTIGHECYFAGQVGLAHGLTIGDRCAILNAAGVSKDLPNDSVIAGRAGDIKPFPSSRIRHLL